MKNNMDLNKMLNFIWNINITNKLIVGDFNYGKIDWVNVSTEKPPGSSELEFVEKRSFLDSL
jgi:hypothetical protein